MYTKNSQSWVKHLDFIILDILCLQLAFVLSYATRHGWHNPYTVFLYRNIAIVLTLLDVLVIVFFGTLKNILRRGYYKEFTATIKQVFLVGVLGICYLFSVQAAETYSRTVFFVLPVFYALFLYVTRLIWKRRLQKRVTADGERSLLVLASKEHTGEILESIRKRNYGVFHLAGLVISNRDMQGETLYGCTVVANMDNVLDYLCREWVDEVFVGLSSEEDYPKELIDSLTGMGLTVHIELANTVGLQGRKQFVEQIGSFTVLTASINYATLGEIFFKRCLDIAGGLVGTLATGVLCLILGPLIYLQSPGPIFFAQERVGRNGKRFKMYKFRSMYLDAEERKAELMEQNRIADGMMFKLDFDPRIIGCKKKPDGTVKKGIGNYIRDWSLDEFPQFFNVLKGDMSLVGTRPPTVDEWEKYQLPHRIRMAIKPGITGMWQVSGRSGITDFEDVVKLDSQYIAEWSMAMDFRILAKTVFVVLKKDGAM